ncbi:sigma-70 family RNA polymerase sigma factor [Virgibacillus sp. Bac332]|uniref:sigma-70 family RNA polymerase sigma factor n=1 Tax=Virgibacillus sp. Bac332 TaxID=2419842 RepID=UPI000EF522DA|nr:sigma-70 family RNA polymerase sigma factor [Virgibacillus sp. Bac332]
MFNEKEILSESDTNEILLEELMGLYGDELKRIAYLYVNDISQSEDIVQEVFISCYKNFHRFNKKSSYKTWLYRITINKCKDYQRKWSFRNIVYKPVISTIKGLLIHEEVEKQ